MITNYGRKGAGLVLIETRGREILQMSWDSISSRKVSFECFGRIQIYRDEKAG